MDPITPLETWSDSDFEYKVSASDLIPRNLSDHVPSSLCIFLTFFADNFFVRIFSTYDVFCTSELVEKWW